MLSSCDVRFWTECTSGDCVSCLMGAWGASQKGSLRKQQKFSARVYDELGLIALLWSWDHTVNYLQFYNMGLVRNIGRTFNPQQQHQIMASNRGSGQEVRSNRQRNGELSLEIRAAILIRLNDGQKAEKTATELNLSQHTVYYTKKR